MNNPLSREVPTIDDGVKDITSEDLEKLRKMGVVIEEIGTSYQPEEVKSTGQFDISSFEQKVSNEENSQSTEEEVDPVELLDFYEKALILGQAYKKTYYIGVGPKKTGVTLRTRRGWESTLIFEQINNLNKNTIEPLYLQKVIDYNTAFSLDKFGDTSYDKGDLKERLSALEEFPTVKKQIVWALVEKFDKHVEKMRLLCLNFSTA